MLPLRTAPVSPACLSRVSIVGRIGRAWPTADLLWELWTLGQGLPLWAGRSGPVGVWGLLRWKERDRPSPAACRVEGTTQPCAR